MYMCLKIMKYFHLHYNLHGWRSERNLLECVEICRENIITMCLRLLKHGPSQRFLILFSLDSRKLTPMVFQVLHITKVRDQNIKTGTNRWVSLCGLAVKKISNFTQHKHNTWSCYLYICVFYLYKWIISFY